jgi:hypothetical protein
MGGGRLGPLRLSITFVSNKSDDASRRIEDAINVRDQTLGSHEREYFHVCVRVDLSKT